MTDFTEHPDHTGSSANPDAPWNQPDSLPAQLRCGACGHEPDPADGFEEGSDCLYSEDAFDPCRGQYEIKEK